MFVQQIAWEDKDSIPLEREQARFLSVNKDSASLHSRVLSSVTVSMGALHVAPRESGLRKRAQGNALPWLLPLPRNRKFFPDRKSCTFDQHPGNCRRLQATSRVKSQTLPGSWGWPYGLVSPFSVPFSWLIFHWLLYPHLPILLEALTQKVSFDLQKSLRGIFLFPSNGENTDPGRVKDKPKISITNQSQNSN